MSEVVPFVKYKEMRVKIDALTDEQLFQMRLLLLENENIDLKSPEWGTWIDTNRVEQEPPRPGADIVDIRNFKRKGK
jgi:hypothetical protein